jgi:hypothetical protein
VLVISTGVFESEAGVFKEGKSLIIENKKNYYHDRIRAGQNVIETLIYF